MISSVEFLTSQTALRSNSQVFSYLSKSETYVPSAVYFKPKNHSVLKSTKNDSIFSANLIPKCLIVLSTRTVFLAESKHSRISHIFFKRDDDENKCIEVAGILLSTFNKQHLQLSVLLENPKEK